MMVSMIAIGFMRKSNCRNNSVKTVLLILGVAFLGIMVLFLFQGAEAGTITVDDDGGGEYTKIQDAINASEDGDTIRVWEGTYYENVVVNKSVSLIGNGSEETVIDGGGEGIVVLVSSNWSNVTGFTIQESGSGEWRDAGIRVDSSHNTISDTICSNNEHGILLYYQAGNNTLINNTCLENRDRGIALRKASDNILTSNNCSSNRIGIWFGHSANNNLLEANTCSYNDWYGIYLDLESSYNHIANGTCSDNKLVGIDVVEDSNYNTIENNLITHHPFYGISVSHSCNNLFFNNTISENDIGIRFVGESEENEVHTNSFFNNTKYGINATGNDGYYINADYNYWGSNSGPYHPEKNPNGTGDNITDYVKFRPCLNENGTVNKSSGEGTDNDETSLLIPTVIVVGGSITLFGLAFLRENFRFAFYSIFTTPLYTKLERDELLNQSNRLDIYTYLVQNPGANYSSLLRALPMGNGTLVHHLNILEREGFIRSRKELGRKIFYPKDSGFRPDNRMAELPVSPIQTRIMDHLKENGPSSMREIEEKCALKQPSVSYNIQRLVERGQVISSGEKRNALYRAAKDLPIKDN